MNEFMTDEEFAASIAAMSLTQVTVSDFPTPSIVTIKGFKSVNNPDQPRAKWELHVREFDRPYLPCTTMRRVLAAAWGKPSPTWIGRQMRIYNDPAVMFGRRKTGGLRIDGLSHWRGGHLEVDVGRGQTRKFRVDALGGGEAPRQPKAPTLEGVVSRLTERGLMPEAVDQFGDNLDAWDLAQVIAWAKAQPTTGGAA